MYAMGLGKPRLPGCDFALTAGAGTAGSGCGPLSAAGASGASLCDERQAVAGESATSRDIARIPK
jgi:hypothetical protein